jgi:hydroxyacylglutathione hydrolase
MPGELTVIKVGPLGPYDNNAYLLIDHHGREAIAVDAPPESEKILEAAEGLHIVRIVITHGHPDHWLGLPALRSATRSPVYCHQDDAGRYASQIEGTLAGGEEIRLGSVSLRVIHTPGHTPGSICLFSEGILIAGDTLFPGGPGHTDSPEDLRQEIRSIVERLFVLPDGTLVHPGHGDSTTIGAARKEYAVFASRAHPADLCGDVLWEG